MKDYSAYIVTDLGFGDSGKGTTVDALARAVNPSLVIRSNGGCQAAHTVVTPEEKQHTFHIFGSHGLCSDRPTYCTKDVVLHPLVMRKEALDLGGIETLKRLIIDPESLVTTTYQSALNRIREEMSTNRSGSCGIGFGETIQDSIEHPDQVIRVKDCMNKASFAIKLRAMQKLKQEEANKLTKGRAVTPVVETELALLHSEEEFEAIVDLYHDILCSCNIQGKIDLQEYLKQGPIICEGAQGVLIGDATGYSPFHTWSDCTSAPAVQLLQEHNIFDYCRLGVIRALPSRHGAGPFPTASAELTYQFEDPNNPANHWQGSLRVGWLDEELIRYAVKCNGGIEGLVVTHMDLLDRLNNPDFLSYRPYKRDGMRCECAICLFDIKEGGPVAWMYRSMERGEILPTLQEWVDAPVVMTSYGPRSDQKMIASGWFQPSTCNSASVEKQESNPLVA